MRLRLALTLLVLAIVFVCVSAEDGWRRHRDLRNRRGFDGRNRRSHYNEEKRNTDEKQIAHLRRSNRRHRQIHRFPARDERTRLNCRVNEHWLKCGPEPHCEKACDNIYSPPHCQEMVDHPKCYFPRCVCDEEFVRNRQGYCIKEWKCPNLYEDEGEDDGYSFKKHYKKRFW